MAHKSNPIGFRLKNKLISDSQWYANYNYSEILHDNLIIENIIIFLLNKLKIITNQIIIKRTSNNIFIFVYAYSTVNINKLNVENEIINCIQTYTGIFDQKISLNFYNYAKIYNLKKNNHIKSTVNGFKNLKKLFNFKDLIFLSYISIKTKNVTGFCYLLAKTFKRKSYPHKQLISFATKLFTRLMHQESNFIGFRINFKGRINGKMRAKKLYVQKGRVSLQTIYATIAYSSKTSYSRYGTFGLRIWLCFTESTINYINFINKKTFIDKKYKNKTLLLPEPFLINNFKTKQNNINYSKNFLVWFFLYKFYKTFQKNYNFKDLNIFIFKLSIQNNFYKKYYLYNTFLILKKIKKK